MRNAKNAMIPINKIICGDALEKLRELKARIPATYGHLFLNLIPMRISQCFPNVLSSRWYSLGALCGGVCFDPFMGAGTTAVVAKKLGRNFVGIELNPAYIEIAERRLAGTTGNLFAN